ncbi:HAMP domain-containing sensor histidine kinase [Jatrophihabitans sp.]|uniref:HAMP domain-containing sensor histidine kinase n=1 Tax=Jatrophihabitans sp. TaxID=1932789 RepID=UPI002C2EFD22|nr:HAMP domain-containing sensor histidine kinase [Jatrophihabitans sp.]
MRLPAGTLAQRISALAVGVAVITALLAGVLAVNLVHRSNAAAARTTLGNLADLARAAADQGPNAEAAQQRARAMLRSLGIQSAAIDSSGRVSTASPLLRATLSPADVRTVLATGSLSAQRRIEGHRVLIEARGTRTGGIVLAQRRSEATAAADRTVRRIVWALLVAVGIAALLGLLVAIRISGPLRRTADAAHALADGRRDVAVLAEGPAEVAEVATAVNTLAAALSHSEARQREFLLSVSHELRTPLTAITGYAESLAEGVVPPEQAAEVGAVVLTESRRLDRLVADLLDLARLDAQEFRVELFDIDLGQLCRDAGRVWSGRCATVGVRFELELSAGPGTVRTDPGRLRQVLDGLLENALRVTPAGAPIVLAARTEPGPDGRGLAVAEVRDGGPGLTEDDLAVAFQRSALYQRYRGVRQVGTGLGLAIVAGLVGRLGGTVEAGRAPEGGARFTVRLPAV